MSSNKDFFTAADGNHNQGSSDSEETTQNQHLNDQNHHQGSSGNEETTQNQHLNKQECSLCHLPFLPNTVSSPNTSQINFKCDECVKTICSIPSGFPFELVNKVKEYECPICLSLIKDATELPCTHLMCEACLAFYEDGEIKKYKE